MTYIKPNARYILFPPIVERIKIVRVLEIAPYTPDTDNETAEPTEMIVFTYDSEFCEVLPATDFERYSMEIYSRLEQ